VLRAAGRTRGWRGASRDLEFHVTPYDTTLVTEGDRSGHRAPDIGVEWEAAYVYSRHPAFAAYDANLDYRRLVPNFFIDAMDPSAERQLDLPSGDNYIAPSSRA
jgi:hypothetical protein